MLPRVASRTYNHVFVARIGNNLSGRLEMRSQYGTKTIVRNSYHFVEDPVGRARTIAGASDEGSSDKAHLSKLTKQPGRFAYLIA